MRHGRPFATARARRGFAAWAANSVFIPNVLRRRGEPCNAIESARILTKAYAGIKRGGAIIRRGAPLSEEPHVTRAAPQNRFAPAPPMG
jgi:hypothetical protein